jgi:hypothetical protein
MNGFFAGKENAANTVGLPTNLKVKELALRTI